MAEVVAEGSAVPVQRRGLTSTVNLAQVTWATIAWIITVAIGAGLRLFQLGASSLSPHEARKAFDSWSLFYGATEGPYRE
ncbi:MAG: hypothetical protein M3Y37_05155, partial [Chloroflexota bacterium]|nr:hypothetical protein [Chloroflexota bacterium]